MYVIVATVMGEEIAAGTVSNVAVGVLNMRERFKNLGMTVRIKSYMV